MMNDYKPYPAWVKLYANLSRIVAAWQRYLMSEDRHPFAGVPEWYMEDMRDALEREPGPHDLLLWALGYWQRIQGFPTLKECWQSVWSRGRYAETEPDHRGSEFLMYSAYRELTNRGPENPWDEGA